MNLKPQQVIQSIKRLGL